MNYDELLNHIKRIHFIGIGGSGMCPIAEILMSEGYEISGSDMNEGETLDKMKGYGIPVYMGHAAENIKGAELVVYSAAVKETNPERKAAVEQGIPSGTSATPFSAGNSVRSTSEAPAFGYMPTGVALTISVVSAKKRGRSS